MKLVLKNTDGDSYSLQIRPGETFYELRRRIEEEAGISLDLKDIAVQGRKIQDTQKVLDYFFTPEIPEPVADQKCVVPGCENTKRSAPDKAFFHFPQEEIRCHQWALYCQRLSMVSGKHRLILNLDSTICSDHFRADQFVKNTTTLLKRTAVPCKCPELPTSESSIGRSHPLARKSSLLKQQPKDSTCISNETVNESGYTEDGEELLCRLCAQVSNSFLFIFDDNGIKNGIAEKISACLPIAVKMTDSLPKQICLECYEQLGKSYALTETCINAENKLKLLNNSNYRLPGVSRYLSSTDTDNAGEECADVNAITGQSTTLGCPLCIDGFLIKSSDPSSFQTAADPISLPYSLPSPCSSSSSSSTSSSNSLSSIQTVTSLYQPYDTVSVPSLDSVPVIFSPSTPHSGNNKTLIVNSKVILDTSGIDSPHTSSCSTNSALVINSGTSSSSTLIASTLHSPVDTSSTANIDSIPDLNGAPESNYSSIVTPDCINIYEETAGAELEIEPEQTKFNHLITEGKKDGDLVSDIDNPINIIDVKTDDNLIDTIKNSDNNLLSGLKNPGSLIIRSVESIMSSIRSSDHLITNIDDIMEVRPESMPGDPNWIPELAPRTIDDIYMYSCRICCADFRTFQAVSQHALMHSDDGFYQCTLCDSCFTTQDDLDGHFLKHTTDNLSCDAADCTCTFCGIEFRTPDLLSYHKCISVSLPSNKCKICFKTFRSESRLMFHMKFHSGAKPGYCEICQKTFPDEVKLYKHVTYLHTTEKTHCCEECGKVFRSVSSLKYHQRTHQGEDLVTPFTCDQCGKCFIRKSMLRNHVSTNHKKMSHEGSCFTCKHCNEAFPSTSCAVVHMESQHKTECNETNTYSFEMHIVNRLYMCEYCERCFIDNSTLSVHRDLHLADYPYQCKYCCELFQSFAEHSDHKVKHVIDYQGEYSGDFEVPIAYLCEYCERSFVNYIKFSEHLTVHYGNAPYHCRYCTLKFSSYQELILHRSTHEALPADEYRPYECHYCNKTFAIEDALIKHIRMHTGEKPFICDQCGKGFSQSSGLYTHQKVHSNERPYGCPICPRTFKIKGDRDVHVRKHSGDRPYKCEFCGKAFMTQHVYSQHRKIHTGERPYKCDVCGIAFRRSHVLTVHKRIHTGEKPNVCDICGKRYRQKGDMLKHRRVQHGYVKVKIQKIEF